MGAGFFLVFFLEKVILKCYKKSHRKKIERRQEQCYQFNKVNGMVQQPECGISAQDISNITHVNANGQVDGAPVKANDCPLLGTGECCNDDVDVKVQMTESDEATLSGPIPLPPGEDEDTAHAHSTRSLILIVALSLHRIFEGMSLGLQHSTQNVWNLFIAVLCHETVIGFGLGLQFVKNRFSFRKMLLATVLCSLIMPIGVAIGTVLVEVGGQSNSLNLVNGILQGISTGTFIYVTFFEILQEEIDPHDTSLSKFFSVFAGFLVMAALCAIPEDQSDMSVMNNTTIICTTTTLAP